MAIPGSDKKNIKLSYNKGYLNIINKPDDKEYFSMESKI